MAASTDAGIPVSRVTVSVEGDEVRGLRALDGPGVTASRLPSAPGETTSATARPRMSLRQRLPSGRINSRLDVLSSMNAIQAPSGENDGRVSLAFGVLVS